MSAGRIKYFVGILVWALLVSTARAETARNIVQKGNRLYSQGQYDEAIEKYDEAILAEPAAIEPKFNKADSLYRLDEIDEAETLYKQVATESKDMALVAKAKYNLGNGYFQKGNKQRESNLEDSLEDYKESVSYWRGVLDLEPSNEKAAKNIEVARLVMKDVMDQINKQKQDPNQGQDPNQPQDPNQTGEKKEQDQSESKDGDQGSQDDQDQEQQDQGSKDANEPSDPNQSEQQQAEEQEQQEEQEEKEAVDATARQILDKEKEERKKRRMLQRGRYQKVEKDW